ncbi:sigma-70 family RNA polymerase sigma factor [Achromobacter xylosoxidans]|uniref:RNA polymerase subunit sigma n=1 Tax=Alcaligenes xylosoxydans xylosoxydans TaxID=85698 RepID=A0A1R1JYU8_ALCXX|nr:sigma-70 family RNA polymerase sigma factor [Achromobacter xylosoxidans]MCH1993925.1 sigma-70 family RNA polymerase sigma factor [Achromobacter xylosoxidans]OMG92337.1 RNA polymerase subunit sigma [Achromobacter xylosoxidans]BEG75742.1 putative RNA polymerase sigma factor FecI [Achromobacter xylosoxidans]
MSNLALACGDAVHLLYRAHHGWLHNWLRAKLGDSFDAADLAQDTFVRVLRHRHELDALREPRAYLTTIAKRLVLNLHRRRSLERAYLDALATLPEARAPSPEQRLLVLETLQEIDEMLAGLPLPARQAFLMAQLEGLGHAEIAARLNVSLRSVHRYIAKGYEQCIMAVM